MLYLYLFHTAGNLWPIYPVEWNELQSIWILSIYSDRHTQHSRFPISNRWKEWSKFISVWLFPSLPTTQHTLFCVPYALVQHHWMELKNYLLALIYSLNQYSSHWKPMKWKTKKGTLPEYVMIVQCIVISVWFLCVHVFVLLFFFLLAPFMNRLDDADNIYC